MKKYNTFKTYIGNLFIVKDGFGTVSDKKYVVVKRRKNYYTVPDNIKVYVGSYLINKNCEGCKFLINAKMLSDMVERIYVDEEDIKLILAMKNK